MKNYFDVLRTCPLFHGISEQDLGAMLSCLGARAFRCKKSETLTARGKPQDFAD